MLEGPDLLPQPLPLDRSILWKPGVEGGGGGTGLIPDPIFVTQAAVAALREHAGTAPEKSLLGFLIGDLCEAPDSAARYILVGSTIRVTQPVQGDRTTIVLKALWDRVRAEVKKRGNHLLGWYHTHQALGIELSSYDVETHERYFTEPWQVAVVVGTAEGEPAAGFFRPGVDENWAATCLPFYEVLKDESLGESGKKRSYVVWKNYRAFNAASDRTTRVMSAPRADAIPPPPPPPPRRSAPHATAPAAPPPPRPAPSPPAAEPEARDEEPEDRGELRFLTAADDMLRPPAPPPARFPPPPSRPSVPGLVGDDAFATDQGKIPSVPRRSGAEPRPEAAAPTASARRTAPHAIPRRARRRWSRVVGVGLALLVAVGGGGALYWQFGSQLLPPPEA